MAYGMTKGAYEQQIAQEIVDTYHIKILSGTPLVYRDGVYVQDAAKGNPALCTAIAEAAPELSMAAVKSIRDRILLNFSLAVDYMSFNRIPSTYVPLKDCILDLETMETIEHSPDYMLLNSLPVTYDELMDADGELMEAFIEGLAPDEDDRLMLLRYIGYMCTLSTNREKFLVVEGEGGTGKSTLLKLIQNALNMNNCSVLSMQDLSDPGRFQTTKIFGKLAVTNSDLTSRGILDTSLLKQIVTGDLIASERKFGEFFEFQPYCKLLYACNRMPHQHDEASGAYYRRMLILKAPSKIKLLCDPAKFEEKILKEKNFLLKISLIEYSKFIRLDEQRLDSPNSIKRVQRLRGATDSSYEYITHHICEGTRGDYINRSTLYQMYSEWCESEDLAVLGKREFFTRTESLLGECTKRQGAFGWSGWMFADESSTLSAESR